MSQLISKILCILLLLQGLEAQAASTVKEVQSVNTFMTKFIHAYEQRDLKGLLQCYGPHAVVIGTGKDEILQGRSQILSAFKRDLDQHSLATISMKPIAIDVEKNVAFASYDLSVNVQLSNEKSFVSPLRLTVGLVKHGSSWLVVQSHLSAAMAGQEEGQAFPKS